MLLDNIELTDIKKTKTGEIKPIIKDNLIEPINKHKADQNLIVNEDLKKSQEFDDLVGFPSDDETSKKFKNEVIDEINLNITNSENGEELKDYINEKQNELQNIQDGRNEENQKDLDKLDEEIKSDINNTSEDKGFSHRFPNINEGRASIKNGMDLEGKIYSNFNLLNEFGSINESNKIQPNKSKELNSFDTNDKISKSIDELFESSNDKYDFEKDFILLESKQNNRAMDEDEKRSTLNEDQMPGFTMQESTTNKINSFPDETNEDVVPSKPSSLDVDDIPKIDFVPESEDASDSKINI